MMWVSNVINHLPYIIAAAIMCVGIYGIAISGNYVKRLICLNILQSGAILFFIAISKVNNSNIPILECLNSLECIVNSVNPLPHVLMLTAIVVGVATLAVGLALTIKIKEDLGTIEEKDLIKTEQSESSV